MQLRLVHYLVLLALVAAVPVSMVAGSADTTKVDDLLTNSFISSYSVPAARSYMASIQDNGTWTDIDYTAGCNANRATWAAATQLSRLYTMSQAWYAPGSTLHSNSTLLGKIMLGLEYWLANDYSNELCTDWTSIATCPCNTTGLWNTNWWYNMIGVQLDLGPTCLLLRSAGSTFTSAQRNHCSVILQRSNWSGFTGANTLWLAQNIIYDGLLRGNDSQVAAAFAVSNGQLYYSPASNDGIKEDGSFLQHSGQLYTGGYGGAFATTYLSLFTPAAGTAFASNDTQQAVFSTFILDGFRWMVVYSHNKNFFDPSVVGRQISRLAGLDESLDTTELTNLTAGWPRQSEFSRFAQELNSKNGSAIVGNRMFWASDYMVHRRANYFVSVKGFSTRIANSECVNSENLLGLHLSDGAMYLHQSGNEYYRYNGTYNSVFPLWDFYHIPGITVDYGAQALQCSQVYHLSSQSFVGGASDGTYGVFAMRFLSPFTRNLSFQKSWFFFDDEIVVLAANITSANGSIPVHSVLDSKVLTGNIYSSVGGTSSPLATGTTTSSKPWWLHHDSVGYIFPDNYNTANGPVSLHLSTAINQTASWSLIGQASGNSILSTFSAWLTRQSAPVVNDSLAYVVVPAVSLANFDPAASLGAVQVVSNTAQVQAVFHNQLQLLGVVFWTAGAQLSFAGKSGWNVSADQPCVALVHEVGNQVKVTVSDPTQLLTGVTLTLDRAVECANCEVSSDKTSTTLAFNLSSGTGASITVVTDASNSAASTVPSLLVLGLVLACILLNELL